MEQKKFYIRKLLNLPIVYRGFQNFIAKNNGRQEFYDKYVGDVKGKRILDLGCGTGDVLDWIHGYTFYVGIDNNEKYIEQNIMRYKKENIIFYCTDLNTYAEKANEKFDYIFMIGVIHHISDDEVNKAMKNIKKLLNKGGQFVSIDPCYTKPMNPIAWLLCKLDRGHYVRYKLKYIEIMKKWFKNIWFEIRTDTLRFLPYNVIIFKTKD